MVHGIKPIKTQLTFMGTIVAILSMDSDLEAFSHYPAPGSFAALPYRTAANTN